ncbi:hypothetical protein EGM51_06240 [Verrucomicrobia bacterium S94]|nr:hypothetical protein EGM51_06240 [Verrucomicrobia bacterium S94]
MIRFPKPSIKRTNVFIAERRVFNVGKILSLHEPDIHVLVRGRTGAEVEFGNGLYAEQADGWT